MFLAKKLNKGAGSPAAPADAQFNYVTMLLHGDGTNGAQNNTFLDSSTNNFTITRNGNTTQGSFSPYGSNWSNFLNGSSGAGGGPYLSFPNSSTMQLGSGNFTIEAWCYFNVVQESTIIARYPFDSTNNEWNFGTGSSLIPNFSYTTGGNTTAGSVGGSGALSTNTWYHIAVVRNSSTLTMYINGTSVATSSISATIYSGTTTTTVGCYAQSAYPGGYAVPNGYLSNVRVVKGTAVYTSNFTPSTTPLTAISGTSLLTCQSNRFVDNSTNNFAVTLNSTPSVQRFNPFGTSTAYSTSVIGGSGYFDGSGDYLGIANNTALQWGTGDFCVEMWVNPSSAAGGKTVVCKGTNNTGTFEVGIYASNKIELYTTALVFTSTASAIANAWTHIAITRSGTTLRCFINGALDTTVTSSYDFNNTSTFYVGIYGDVTSNPFNGYISNVRCVKGSAVYTSAFTPNTAPLTAITNTQLLLNTTNGAIFDNAMMNDLETAGNTQISTSVKKYGTGSLAFDGTGDYLTGKTLPIGSGDLTIECWVYLNVATGDQHFVQVDGASDSNVFLSLDSGANKFKFVVRNDAGTNNISITSSISPSANTWYHIAGVVSGSSAYLFVNGSTTSGATGTLSGTRSGTGTNVYLGVNGSGGFRPLNGYLDDVRITKGYARYTTNFTAPTAALSDTGPI